MTIRPNLLATRPNLLAAVRQRPLRVLLWAAVVFVIAFLAAVVATVWAAVLVFPATMAGWSLIVRDGGRPSEQDRPRAEPD